MSKMTDGEILQKAIEIAIGNGFRYKGYDKFMISPDSATFYTGKFWVLNDSIDIHRLIFSHEFAKAFWGKEESELTLWKLYNPLKEGEPAVYVGTYVLSWGEEKNPTVGFVQAELPAWELHLQTMVLEKEPIKYLAKFL